MNKHTRRQVIVGGLVAASAAPFQLLTKAWSQAPAAAEPGAAKRLALTAARVVNTAQTLHKKHLGSYGRLEDLANPVIRDIYSKWYAPDVLEKVRFTPDEVVPGFRAYVDLGPERNSYRIFIIEKSAQDSRRFAYASDESGMIQEGTVSADERTPPSVSFLGKPIQKPRPAATRSKLTGFGLALATFFVPTVHAEDQCGSCAQCFDGTASECGSTCGVNCCNLGYELCPWCCKTWHVCDCPS